MRKDLRLKKAELFTSAYRDGRSLSSRQAVLFYLRLGAKGPTKAGFSVSKKIGKAVTRNKIKRRLKSIFGSIEGKLRGGYILVFVARPPAAESSFADLKEAVCRLLRQAKILEEDK